MEIEHIKYLQTIAKCKSINLAGELLHYQSQKLYRIVNKIESEYHIRLFERSNHGVILTKDGEKFLELAEKMLEINTALHQITQNNLPSSTLNVAFSSAMTRVNPFELISNFIKEHPYVQLNFKENENNAIIQSISQHRLSIGGVYLIDPFETDNNSIWQTMKIVPLSRNPIYIVVAADSTLAKTHDKITLAEIIKMPIILTNENQDNIFYRLLSFYETPNVQFATTNMTLFAKLLMENKDCCTMTLRYPKIWLPTPNKIKLIPLDEDISVLACLLIDKTQASSAIVQEFCDYLVPMFK